jgi:hypothetical protein
MKVAYTCSTTTEFCEDDSFGQSFLVLFVLLGVLEVTVVIFF